jgi:hypothetical protein
MDETFPFHLPPELELLALMYAAPSNQVRREFYLACAQGRLRLARRLAAMFGPEIGDSCEPLRGACRGGHLEVARWLVGHFDLTGEGVRVVGGVGALANACENGHLEVARWLADRFGLTPSDALFADAGTMSGASAASHLGPLCWRLGRFGPAVENMRFPLGRAVQNSIVHGRLAVARWLVGRFDLTAGRMRANLGLPNVFGSPCLPIIRQLVARLRLGAEDVQPCRVPAMHDTRAPRDPGATYWLIARFGLVAEDAQFAHERACTRGWNAADNWIACLADFPRRPGPF